MKVARLSHTKQLILNLLWFPLNAETAALLTIVIPTQILLFVPSSQVGSAEQATVLSWLAVVASIVSLLMPPFIGALSDRTRGRLGRRRPCLLAGGLLLVASTPLLVNASTSVDFLAGLALLLVGMNIINSAYQSLVPDRVPKEQRGMASGYVGGLTILGSVASLGLAAYLLGEVNQHAFNADMVRHNAGVYYVVTATLVTLGILITVLGVHEIPYSRPSPSVERERTIVGFAWRLVHHWVTPWRKSNFTLVFLTRTAIMLGLAMFMTYVEYYFARVQNVTNFVATTALIAVLALSGGVVSGILSGVLSDRMRRRAPVVQPLSVVDNSAFSPTGLTAPSDARYDEETFHATHFKQRGLLWPFICSCSCSWSVSSLWRCFGVFAGSLFSLPIYEEGPSVAHSTVC